MKLFAQSPAETAIKQAAADVKAAVPSRFSVGWLLGSYDDQRTVEVAVVTKFRAFMQALGSPDSLESLQAVHKLGTWVAGKNPDLAELVTPAWVMQRSPKDEAARRLSQSTAHEQDMRDRIADDAYRFSRHS